MASVNKVIILGNLGHPPEVRYAADGAAITNLSVATSYKSKDKEHTEWHRVVLFGRTAEVAGQYLDKGSSVYIEGRLQTKKWTDKNGVDKYTTEIVGDVMQMLSKGKSVSEQQAPTVPSDNSVSAVADLQDDIPF